MSESGADFSFSPLKNWCRFKKHWCRFFGNWCRHWCRFFNFSSEKLVPTLVPIFWKLVPIFWKLVPSMIFIALKHLRRKKSPVLWAGLLGVVLDQFF
jgi:hypothetical protein